MKLFVAPIILLSLYISHAAGLQTAGCKYFQSRNYPDRYFGLSGTKGVMVHYNSTRAYRLVPGLIGTGVSFQSCADPNKYLRHDAGYIIWEHTNDSTPLFRKDASFRARENFFFPGYTVFESVNYPYHYIRHAGFVLQINEGGTSLFRNDASYKLMQY